MKQIISINLGSSQDDYEFETEFLGQQFNIKRIGTNSDMEKAASLVLEWDSKADAIGIGNIKFPYNIGQKYVKKHHEDIIETLGDKIQTPVTSGNALRDVSFEWALRFIDHKYKDYFKNSKVLFLSGMINYKIAKVMEEYTDNLTFADPLLEKGIPKFIHSVKSLEAFANGTNEILGWLPTTRVTSSVVPIKKWNQYLLKKAMQKANIIVVPFYSFYEYLKDTTLEELGGKTIITSTAYDDRVKFLKERGV
ncbi:dehydrogenase, partial [bacterium]|nr:dehydrogenase [bacterium]